MWILPREALRNTELLENIKNDKWKIKCLVNEACIYGCPQNINHACYLSLTGGINISCFCNRNDWRYSDLLRTNFILPRWLKNFDNLVDIYILSGRRAPTFKIVDILDAYVNERNDVNLLRIIMWRNNIKAEHYMIPMNRVPYKLLTCRCKVCESVMRQCLSNIQSEDLKYEF